ncbi:sodium:solute symporter [Ohtaekwangia koreensis]|uniref:Na+/proline symporter n=1 Tax=Ohtaekwangia koreensis TaxID=688867 RepID=A0A1T5L8W9_9BACT|nr:sodium:solute symporter [Ohtaekwangia koreensis]SKC72109.1 Na+/proline symporter [Ohtaekwangia koreensis]
MTPTLVATIMVIYFGALIFISIITSRGADTNTFFTGNRQSPWYLVAFGMIGSSLSGVTFISVPGNVGKVGFGYFQVVLGYLVGYWLIIGILMPLYYRLNLISIYTYLEQRFSFWTYKTGAFFFLVSRTIGSSLRLFLAATVLQLFLFDAWHVPFFVTVATTIILIWVYTFKGGIKTIVWTDSFQTIFLISAVCIAVWQITSQLGMSFSEMVNAVSSSKYSKMFYFDDVNSTQFFWKQFIGGAFITLTMTGMDQEIMQKNLTCKNLGEAQKNMFWFSLLLVFVNLLFITLGALLYMYSSTNGVALPASSDELFPRLAFNELGLAVGIFFLLGITASSYASADSALAGLTTSFCIDFLNFKDKNEDVKRKQKFMVHLGFSLLFLIIILVFKEINERSVIDAVLNIAGYTYGPLLGLFSFGLFTKRQVRDKLVPIVCVLSPAISYLISLNSEKLFNGYKFGIEILVANGIITFIGLWLISRKSTAEEIKAI